MNILLNSTLLQTNPSTPTHQVSGKVAESVADFGQWTGLTGIGLSIVGGLLLLIAGYFIAKFTGRLVKRLLGKTGIDNRAKSDFSISGLIGKLVYYLLMIIVLMATLSLMGVHGDVLAPLSAMAAKFFGAVPNIIAAGIIAYVGYFLAKIVSNLIEASGDKIRSWVPSISGIKDKNEFDNHVSKTSGKIKEAKPAAYQIDVVKILKNIAFIVIFIPVLIIALEKLDMQVITTPATSMLDTFINAIPSIVYAVIILFAAIVGGKLLSRLLAELLHSLNVNGLSRKLKLEHILGSTNMVNVISTLAYLFIIYIGVEEAAKQLGLIQVVEVMNDVLAVAGKIVFGLLILSLGNVVANFTTRIFLKNKNTNKFSAAIVRGAVIVIFLAMGLHAMGIADSIIELSFGLGLGAIAVAFALSFGLGGREAAGEEMKSFFSKLKKKDE